MGASLNGHNATSASLWLHAYGIPWAEVGLDAEVTLSGSVTLQIADLTFVGTVMSGGPSKGRSRYRIAGGAGQWGKTIPDRQEDDNAAGVKRSTVLLAAAQACGETILASTLPGPTDRIGPSYVRERGPASRVMHELCPRAWYVGEDGTTRIGVRTPAAIAVPYTAGPLDLANRQVEIAATSIASIVPGVIVEGLEAGDVLHSIDAEQGLRSTIFGAESSGTSPRLESWRRIDEALDPRRNFRGVTEYRVVTLDGDRLNLQPVLTSLGMPDLRLVVVRPGVAGCKATVALGSRVGVAFMNSSPSRPFVAFFEDAEGDGFSPDRLDLVGEDDSGVGIGDAAGRVVRYGDTIVFPVGAGATPTEMLVATLTPQDLSRVRA